jgi:hypothetical protein
MSKRIVYRTDGGDVVVRYDSDFREYSVHEKGEPYDHDYFTDDRQDAEDTADRIQDRHDERAGRRRNPPAKMPQAFNHKDALEVLANTRRGDLGNNTTMRIDGDDIVVRLYNTDIIVYHPDDSVTLNSGGHRTTTTKGRINSFLSPHISVSSNKGEWFASTGNFRTPFYDGLRIYPKAEPFSHRRGETIDKRFRRNPRKGKFDSDLDAAMYRLSMDGTADDVSHNDEWWGKLDAVTFDEVVQEFVNDGEDEHSARKAWQAELRGKIRGDMIPTVILHEDHNGITTVRYFSSDRDGEKFWQDVQKDIAEEIAEEESE